MEVYEMDSVTGEWQRSEAIVSDVAIIPFGNHGEDVTYVSFDKPFVLSQWEDAMANAGCLKIFANETRYQALRRYYLRARENYHAEKHNPLGIGLSRCDGGVTIISGTLTRDSGQHSVKAVFIADILWRLMVDGADRTTDWHWLSVMSYETRAWFKRENITLRFTN